MAGNREAGSIAGEVADHMDKAAGLPGRREQSKARNRAAILKAAKQVFAELGYEAASVRDIIRRTRLASGTFYNYFRSKEEIAKALASDAAQRLRPILRVQREQATDLESYLNGVIRAYFRFLIEERAAAFPGLPLADRMPPVRITTPAQQAVFEEVRSAIAHALGKQMAPDTETEYLAAAAIGVARYVGQQMLAREPADPEAAAGIAVRLILHGLPAAARRSAG